MGGGEFLLGLGGDRPLETAPTQKLNRRAMNDDKHSGGSSRVNSLSLGEQSTGKKPVADTLGRLSIEGIRAVQIPDHSGSFKRRTVVLGSKPTKNRRKKIGGVEERSSHF